MQTPNRNLFRITRFILLRLPRLFRFLARFRTPQKNLLLLKTDAIGDYVLFRNFIEIISRSEKFKGYRIDLLGNRLWGDIALKYDGEFVNNFFFINPDDLYFSPVEIFKLSIKLFSKNYHTVLQPAFSRTFINDGLAGSTASKNIIGFEGDNERIDARYKLKTDKFYSTLFSLPKNIVFEFDRSKFFIEQVLENTTIINRPFINIENKNREGIIIFPGAGVSERRWEPEKFLALIKLILEQSDAQVLIAGSADETEIGNYLMERLPIGRVSNLTGKTPLTQLIELIGNASLIISNETSAVHIAAAVKTPAICILGGGHFGRFAPYPDNIKDKPFCVYEELECYHCNWNCKFKTEADEPYPCISNLSVEKVWLAAKHFLPHD